MPDVFRAKDAHLRLRRNNNGKWYVDGSALSAVQRQAESAKISIALVVGKGVAIGVKDDGSQPVGRADNDGACQLGIGYGSECASLRHGHGDADDEIEDKRT
ncbi:MAG: hypothetical protein HOL54_03580 [Rhodospirillales bacterium]|nr:hypothetical protein [Rhodospirillales bacterium]